MSTPRIVTHGGLTLDLENIKSFTVQATSGVGRPNVLTVEHKSSNAEYVFNPDIEEYELHFFNNTTEMEYSSYDSVCAHRDEWAEIWLGYLNEKEENQK